MYTNARAARLLRGHDRSTLWELVSAGLAHRPAARLDLPIALEGSWSVACEAIADGGGVVGALLRFDPRAAPDDSVPAQDRRTTRATFGWESLSENERNLAELVVDGLSNREAAARLFVSRHTIDFYLRQIYQKLGIHSRVDLARIAMEHGGLTT
jgi:DNA-binding CsgD family transcriptional regulator